MRTKIILLSLFGCLMCFFFISNKNNDVSKKESTNINTQIIKSVAVNNIKKIYEKIIPITVTKKTENIKIKEDISQKTPEEIDSTIVDIDNEIESENLIDKANQGTITSEEKIYLAELLSKRDQYYKEKIKIYFKNRGV